ncbi:MAG: hypothetical protein AVDCRST_MAG62-940 [uncultured Sphingomonas sp.]|uniref:Uncharacterized protein n=1 Tax=uncultured Sphingomonas sp. TaxID=158754 RepID=A0A6J4TB50_9SPHN|nr:MAG: hypothetical protein AVDCRST_MAG62-940 [uncultured Sphingomonas sp.]
MSVMSIREFNSAVSRTLARVEKGETVEITRNGKVIAELKPPRQRRTDDPEWQENLRKLMKIMDQGIPLGGPASYEERTS